MCEEENKMSTIQKDKKVTNKNSAGISVGFLKTAKRLPSKNGKVTLDRNNPDHKAWAEGYEND
ncbi:hypothetical protein DFQ00_102454 [Paenibacillus barcinonensis]|uniref:Uncharacterized protein n=2 Tax=Paenibacillus barcinonensis TaxID=198119 RepID=A0A2V4WTH5_PAEBA|nr:hypothetical protein DFQ00_102454 [Paenibacillus barcinonensis]